MLLTVFPHFYAQERIAPLALCSFAHLLFFKERLERFASVALYKTATVAIHSGRSWQKSEGESHEKPMSDFPTLAINQLIF